MKQTDSQDIPTVNANLVKMRLVNILGFTQIKLNKNLSDNIFIKNDRYEIFYHDHKNILVLYQMNDFHQICDYMAVFRMLSAVPGDIQYYCVQDHKNFEILLQNKYNPIIYEQWNALPSIFERFGYIFSFPLSSRVPDKTLEEFIECLEDKYKNYFLQLRILSNLDNRRYYDVASKKYKEFAPIKRYSCYD